MGDGTQEVHVHFTEQVLDVLQQTLEVLRPLVVLHAIQLGLQLQGNLLVSLEGSVHLPDLLAVHDLLHETGSDVGCGSKAGGGDASDEDGGGEPGREGGEDTPGYGEASAHHTGAGAHGPADPAPQPDTVQVGSAGSQLLDSVGPGVHQLPHTAAQGQQILLEVLLLQVLGVGGECLVIHHSLAGEALSQRRN